jgi:DNA-binding transcriptional LysR family regulator
MYYVVMFERLFAENGLSLERVRALLEVGACGSIVKAAGGNAVRQSQYSRQIKELEDYFQTRLVERQGKGIRLTANGKELARISRFFLLGLSNFKRGCLTEEQSFRVGAGATFIETLLLPALAAAKTLKAGPAYELVVCADDEIERRLHDLRLDFGIVTRSALSRPLQSASLGSWRLILWVPRALHKNPVSALQAFTRKQIPLALASVEMDPAEIEGLAGCEAMLRCENFLQARAALEGQAVAAVLPDFVKVEPAKLFLKIALPSDGTSAGNYHLAWNPRLLRLNPKAGRRRDWLQDTLGKVFK